jgi:hypothetical protein
MVTRSFLDHIKNKRSQVFPDMILDWKRPKGDDTTNKTKEVNLFKTDIEKLRIHYRNALGLDDLENEPLPNVS